jgi:hypothetical protein
MDTPTTTQLPLRQYLYRVSVLFRRRRHRAVCIYKSKLVQVEAVVLTPAQGFTLEALQDNIGEHPILWTFYGKPYYFVWLGPTACLIPVVELRQVIGTVNDSDEFKLAQWQKSKRRLQKCKKAPDNCECDPTAQGTTVTTTTAGTNTTIQVVVIEPYGSSISGN